MAEKMAADAKTDNYEPEKPEGKFDFVWNAQRKEFFGRTGMSWLKITIFYIIFYACLAAFWALLLIIFNTTLDEREPKWKLAESRIGDNPGLGYRPKAVDEEGKVKDGSKLINLEDSRLYEKYIANLKTMVDGYTKNVTGSHVEDASKCRDPNAVRDPNKFCLFDANQIPQNTECTASNGFGYALGRPCVLIKLNKIFDWEPMPYDMGKVPKELTEELERKGTTYNPNQIYITCNGQNAVSREAIRSVDYVPDGISFSYFPYRNQPGYLAPFIWVQFKDIAQGPVVFVECKAWAANIRHNLLEGEGSVSFEILR